MGEWFEEFFDFNIFDERYQIEGDSKGKTLRGFIEVAEPRLVGVAHRPLQRRVRIESRRSQRPSRSLTRLHVDTIHRRRSVEVESRRPPRVSR